MEMAPMKRKTKLRWVSGAALSLAAAMTVAACGSGTPSGGSGSSSGQATGEPIKIYAIGSFESQTYNFPEVAAATKAYAAALNAKGGINGRPLEVTSCNDKADPNEAAVCARAAQTNGAVAVIGGISTQGDVITSTLDKAGIVLTGQRPLTPGDYSSKISFPLVGGTSSSGTGLGLYAGKEGACTKVYWVASNIPPSLASQQSFVAGLKYANPAATAVGQATPVTVPDYSAIAAAAAATNPDCFYLGVTNAEWAKAYPAIKGALPNVKVFTTASNVSPDVAKALGSSLDGVLASDSQLPLSDTSNPAISQYLAEMKQYAPDAAATTIGLSSWAGAKALVENVLVKQNGDITPATVLDAYNKLGSVDSAGVFGDFSFQAPPADPKMPRQFNRTYIVYAYKNTVGDLAGATFQDATAAIKAQSGSS
jgi:ABC-type branched-subunit amino acid transport system substrate-binding protein